MEPCESCHRYIEPIRQQRTRISCASSTLLFAFSSCGHRVSSYVYISPHSLYFSSFFHIRMDDARLKGRENFPTTEKCFVRLQNNTAVRGNAAKEQGGGADRVSYGRALPEAETVADFGSTSYFSLVCCGQPIFGYSYESLSETLFRQAKPR